MPKFFDIEKRIEKINKNLLAFFKHLFHESRSFTRHAKKSEHSMCDFSFLFSPITIEYVIAYSFVSIFFSELLVHLKGCQS